MQRVIKINDEEICRIKLDITKRTKIAEEIGCVDDVCRLVSERAGVESAYRLIRSRLRYESNNP